MDNDVFDGLIQWTEASLDYETMSLSDCISDLVKMAVSAQSSHIAIYLVVDFIFSPHVPHRAYSSVLGPPPSRFIFTTVL